MRRTNSRWRRRPKWIDHLSELPRRGHYIKRKTKPPTGAIIGPFTVPIAIVDGTNEFTRDCAFIELYRDKHRLKEHVHGKQGSLYIGTRFPSFLSFLRQYRLDVSGRADYLSSAGGNLSPSDFGKLIFSSRSPREVQASYDYPGRCAPPGL